MPGSRDANLRSGDLHEQLGMILLKGIALVAPVPRTEDVGADAFATLLRPESARRLIPEESFLVQIKAASVRKVRFKDPRAVDWLMKLEIPLFIGRVSVKSCTMSLYPTHRLPQIAKEGGHKEVHLCLEPVNEVSHPRDVRYVNTGPPALTWSTPDLLSKTFRETAYAVMKPHVMAQKRNLQFRDLGYFEPLKWEEGKVPQSSGGCMISWSRSDEPSAVLESMVAPLRTLLGGLFATKHYGDLPALLGFLGMMRRHGVDPDPGGTFTQMALLLADGDEISEADIIHLRALGIPGKLDLSYTRISDDALVHIPESTEAVDLRCTRISDAGLRRLRKLACLRRLNLSSTGISDAGLEELASFPKLEWLAVTSTKVTKDGIAKLQVALPALEVVQ